MDEAGDEPLEQDVVRLRKALEIVQAELDRTRSDAPRLEILLVEGECDGEPVTQAYVADRFGSYWSNVSPPLTGSDAVAALATVAEGVQDFLAEDEWYVWPVCPAHRLGVHVTTDGEHAQAPAWWCSGAGGHIVSVIGQVERRRPRPERKQKNKRRR